MDPNGRRVLAYYQYYIMKNPELADKTIREAQQSAVTIKAQSADIRKNVKEQFTALSDNVQKLVTTLNDLYGTSIGSVNNARDLIDDGLALVEDKE